MIPHISQYRKYWDDKRWWQVTEVMDIVSMTGPKIRYLFYGYWCYAGIQLGNKWIFLEITYFNYKISQTHILWNPMVCMQVVSQRVWERGGGEIEQKERLGWGAVAAKVWASPTSALELGYLWIFPLEAAVVLNRLVIGWELLLRKECDLGGRASVLIKVVGPYSWVGGARGQTTPSTSGWGTFSVLVPWPIVDFLYFAGLLANSKSI